MRQGHEYVRWNFAFQNPTSQVRVCLISKVEGQRAVFGFVILASIPCNIAKCQAF